MPELPRPRPLALQVFAAVAAAVGLVFGGSFLHDMMTLTRRLEAQQRATLQALAPLVEGVIEESMQHAEPEHIAELFKALERRRTGGTAEIIDREGRRVCVPRLGQARQSAPTPPPNAVVLEVPLRAKASCARCHGVSSGRLGTLRLVAPPEERAALHRSLVLSRLGMAAVGALVIALASLFVVRRLVHAPLGAVAEAMRRVAEGRLDTRVDRALPGELSLIADGFNGMVSELERDRARITDLHRKQVAHMDRLATLGGLAAQLAHEVRNPLTGLSAALQLMRREAPEGRAGLIDRMLAQLSRMDRTMGEFLRYARLPEAAPRPFALKDALARVLTLLGPRLKAQGIALALSVDEDLPAVLADPGQVEQVLLNLCLNAAQAMDGAGGTLSVSAEAKPGEVVAAVSDTGPGIAPGDLERVFEPFYTTKENGSGLGLPIARQIVMAQGGELWLESQPGRGTTVHVRLPRAGAPA